MFCSSKCGPDPRRWHRRRARAHRSTPPAPAPPPASILSLTANRRVPLRLVRRLPPGPRRAALAAAHRLARWKGVRRGSVAWLFGLPLFDTSDWKLFRAAPRAQPPEEWQVAWPWRSLDTVPADLFHPAVGSCRRRTAEVWILSGAGGIEWDNEANSGRYGHLGPGSGPFSSGTRSATTLEASPQRETPRYLLGAADSPGDVDSEAGTGAPPRRYGAAQRIRVNGPHLALDPSGVVASKRPAAGGSGHPPPGRRTSCSLNQMLPWQIQPADAAAGAARLLNLPAPMPSAGVPRAGRHGD